jgi:hypothetical protein
MADVDDVGPLGARALADAADLRSLDGAAEKDRQLEEAALGPNEEMAGLA